MKKLIKYFSIFFVISLIFINAKADNRQIVNKIENGLKNNFNTIEKLKEVKKDDSLKKLYDLNDDAKIYKSNDLSIILDKDGEVLVFDALDSFNPNDFTLKDQKIDFDINSYTKTVEKLKDSGLIKEEYKLTKVEKNLDHFIDLEFSKTSDDSIYNPFNKIFVTIDKVSKNPLFILKNDKLDIDESNVKTSKEDAIKYFKEFLNKEFPNIDKSIKDIQLKVMEINHPYIEEKKFKIEKIFQEKYYLAYEIILDDGSIFYLNPNSLSLIDYISLYNKENTIFCMKEALEKIDLNLFFLIILKTRYQKFKSLVSCFILSICPKVYIFFFFCHSNSIWNFNCNFWF